MGLHRNVRPQPKRAGVIPAKSAQQNGIFSLLPRRWQTEHLKLESPTNRWLNILHFLSRTQEQRFFRVRDDILGTNASQAKGLDESRAIFIKVIRHEVVICRYQRAEKVAK